jgi:hypothetical protein
MNNNERRVFIIALVRFVTLLFLFSCSSLLAYAQKDASVASKHMLQQLLTQQVMPSPSNDNIQIEYPQCRQAAVAFVMSVFPSNDSTSRFILLAACSDKNDDIRSLASQNLFHDQNDDYPDFRSLLKLILVNAHGEYPMGRQTLVYHPQTYQQMIYYLHRCLLRQRFNGEKATPLWQYEEQLSSLHVLAQQDTTVWYNYVRFILDFVLVVHDCLSTYFLVESIIIGYHVHDDRLIDMFNDNLDLFRQLCLFSTRDDTRRYSSILYAYILSKDYVRHMSAIDELIKILSNVHQRFEQREGSIIALGYVCSYVDSTCAHVQYGKDCLLKLFIEQQQQQELTFALLISIGQLARHNRFQQCDQTMIEQIIEQLRTKLRTINENNRIKEKIIQTFAFLAVCYREQSKVFIDILTESLVDTKQIELQLNIGMSTMSHVLILFVFDVFKAMHLFVVYSVLKARWSTIPILFSTND